MKRATPVVRECKITPDVAAKSVGGPPKKRKRAVTENAA
jgi:hypothetical protein